MNYYAHTAKDGYPRPSDGRGAWGEGWQPLNSSLARRTGEGVQRTGEGRRWHKRWTNSTSAVPDYAGPFRDSTAPCATENHVIPAFLEMVFDQPQNGMNRN